jgi:hypothetical protein
MYRMDRMPPHKGHLNAAISAPQSAQRSTSLFINYTLPPRVRALTTPPLQYKAPGKPGRLAGLMLQLFSPRAATVENFAIRGEAPGGANRRGCPNSSISSPISKKPKL